LVSKEPVRRHRVGSARIDGRHEVLQVTAAISPGSSGSPVMNAKGDVIGIASALLRGGQALNFAVPVECGLGLLAKVKPFSIPQPLNQSANAGATTPSTPTLIGERMSCHACWQFR